MYADYREYTGKVGRINRIFLYRSMKILHMVAFILAMVGALNWGLIGLGSFAHFDGNVVHMLLGTMSTVEEVVYVLVGLSAVWLLVMHKQDCKCCTA